MKLNQNAIGLAFGLLSAIVFVICAIVVWIWPEAMTGLASWWAHIDLTGLARSVTLGSFIGGAILTFVSHFIAGWVFAWFYNKFTK